jgi:hypothetical protein
MNDKEDLIALLNEILCEAYQDHEAEAKLSLSIIREKLQPFSTKEFPYSVQRKLQKEIDKLTNIYNFYQSFPNIPEHVQNEAREMFLKK